MQIRTMQREVSIKRAALSALVFGVLAVAPNALAQEACGDSTCPKGYRCETVPAPCPAIACAPGSDCPVCDGEVEMCVALPCASDADCDEQMVCFEREVASECTGTAPACPPGSECPAPEPAECTIVTESSCVPRWALPCDAAADCGAGFECVEQQSCSSPGSPGSGGGTPARPGGSSGGASGGSSGGAAEPQPDRAPAGTAGSAGFAPPSAPEPAPAPQPAPAEPAPAPAPVEERPEVTCRPSGVKQCQVIERACSADADCPSDWSCVDNPEGVCWQNADGSSGCESADPAKLCLPPYRSLGGGYGETTNGAPGRGEDSGAPPASPTPGSPAIGQGPSSPAGAEGDELAGTDDGSESSEGCSFVGASPSTGGGAAAALLALAALGLRRQRRSNARA